MDPISRHGQTERARILHSKMAMLLVCILLSTGAAAQSYLSATGYPTFNTPIRVHNGTVNLGNGNLSVNISLGSYVQRGGKTVKLALVYNSRIYSIANNGTSKSWTPTGGQGGWRLALGYANGTVQAASVTFTPCGASGYYVYSNYQFIDSDATVRNFPMTTSSDDPAKPSGCTLPYPTSATGYATDSTGYFLNASGGTGTLYYPDGTTFVPAQLNPVGGTANATDANGNFTTYDGQDVILNDTVGRTILHAINIDNPVPYNITNSQNTGASDTALWANVNAATSFGVSGVTEFSGTVYVIQTITLPDGTHTYQFGYDSYGELSSMTLPTGGQVTFTYTNFTDGYGNVNRWVTGYTADGGTWSYTPKVLTTCPSGGQNCKQQVTVTKPSGDSAVYTFTLNNYGAWNTNTNEYSGSPSGTLLRSTTVNYDFSQPNYIRPTSTVVTLPTPAGNINTRKTYYYDSQYYGNITGIWEWKYYIGSNPPNPDRKFFWSYTPDSPGPNYAQYAAKNILDKVLVFTVQDGSNNQLAQTRTTYDSTTLTGISGIVNHDDTNFGTGDTIRGNATLVQKWLTGSTFLNTTNNYDTTGELIKSVDQNNNATTFSFADSYFSDNGANPPATYTPTTATNAFLTKGTLPVSGTITHGYYFGTGKTASTIDQNGADTYFHFVDSLDRQTTTYLPVTNGNRGWTLLTYPSFTETDTYVGITSTTASTSCTSCQHDQQLLDTWGRLYRHTIVSDPDGATNTDTSYDTTSRVASVTNPYRSTSDPTYGSDTSTYDGINRVIAITHSDNNVAHTYYGSAVSSNGGTGTQLCSTSTYGIGYPILTVDEASKKRQSWEDDHGNIIEVDEPDSSNNLTVGTCYKYDVLDDLVQVVQGSETRSYNYDALKRMTSETNPESGTTNYYYTNSTGGLCSGDPSLVCRKTDARGITITFTYDAENRLSGKTYSDTTPSVTFFYDQSSYNGLTITNGKGRRTGMSDGSGQTAWSYDTVGRVLSEERTISGVTKTTTYAYNLDGSVVSKTYPSGRKVTYTVGNAGRAVSAIDTANSINYATSAKYAPQGELASMVNDSVSGGFAGITLTYGYNNRLQMSSAKASSSNGDVFDLGYSYNLGSGVNNGNVASITNNLNTNRTQLFTYDNLDRIATAKTQATSGSYCWGQSFGYDRYGNLLTATVTQCSAPSLSLSVNTNNQITNSGFSYDSAGNLKGDGANSYTWNAENRPTTIGSTTYKYDGDFLRVYKSSGTLEWPDETCTKPLGAETDTSGNTTAEYIWFAGQLIAHRDSSGNVYYHYSDHLTSGRVMTNSTGVTQQESDFYPFGGELAITNNVVNHHKFTSKYRDPETGFDYSFYRMYESNLGRWASSDPIRRVAGDPQQLNRYNYVRNSPAKLTDPSGGFIFPCFQEVGYTDFLGDEEDFPTIDLYCAPLFFLPRISVSGPVDCFCEGVNRQPIVGICVAACECVDDFVTRFVPFAFALLKASPKCRAQISCPLFMNATKTTETISIGPLPPIVIRLYTAQKCFFIP